MCILLLSTAHPKYPLVLLSNRDEFLDRPTKAAGFWPEPDADVIGPMDLAREEHGTWIGVSKSGRIAILVNFREETVSDAVSPISRGALVRHFLVARDQSTSEWAQSAITKAGPGGLFNVGGFSMVCGVLRKRPTAQQGDLPVSKPVDEERLEKMAVLTNRSTSLDEGTSWLFSPDECANPSVDQETDSASWNDLYATVRKHTFGISNSLYTNPWPKVYKGCDLLSSLIAEDIENPGSKTGDKEEFISSLFDILSTDNLPRDALGSGNPALVFDALKHSIKIPVFSSTSGVLKADEDLLSPVPTDSSMTKDEPAVVVQHVNSRFETHTSDKPYEFRQGKYYGTRTQTLILVDNEGHVTYAERDLNDLLHREHSIHEFDIEGWNE